MSVLPDPNSVFSSWGVFQIPIKDSSAPCGNSKSHSLVFCSPRRLLLLLQGEGVLAGAQQRHGGGGRVPAPRRQRLAAVHRDAVGLSGRGTQGHGDEGQRAPPTGPRGQRVRGVLLHLRHRLAFGGAPLPFAPVAAAAPLDAVAGPALRAAMMPKRGTGVPEPIGDGGEGPEARWKQLLTMSLVSFCVIYFTGHVVGSASLSSRQPTYALQSVLLNGQTASCAEGKY